jgi:protease-4
MLWNKRMMRRRGIAVVTLGFPIEFGTRGTPFDNFMGTLRYVKDLRPKALVLRLDTPGGTIGGGQEIRFMIERIRKKGIVVIAHMEDVAASCGFYIAVTADKIMATPGTVTGSIGVIQRSWDFSELLKFVGIAPKIIKSGPIKDALATYRSISPEESVILHEGLLNSYELFCEEVAWARGLDIETVKQFADGRTFNGRLARERGFVDQLGGFDDATELAASLAGIPAGEEQVRYFGDRKPQPDIWEFIWHLVPAFIGSFAKNADKYTMQD